MLYSTFQYHTCQYLPPESLREEKGFSLNEVNRQAYETDADNISANLLSDRPVERFEQTAGKVQHRGDAAKEGDEYGNHVDAVAAKETAGESAAPMLAGFLEQKTDSGERQLQGKSPTDQHSTSSHLSQARTNRLYEAKRLANLGVTQGNKGNYQAALKYFEEALKLYPNSSFIWYCQGLALARLNRLQ